MSSASLRILENVQSMARAEPEGCSNGRGGAKRYCTSHAAVRHGRCPDGKPRNNDRMVTEKVAAAAEAQAVAAASALSGGSPLVAASKALRVVKKRVRANKRRLSRH